MLTVLAPPGESHDTWTRGDVEDDNGDYFGLEWLNRPLAVHAIGKTGFNLPDNSPHGHSHAVGIDKFFGGELTAIPPDYFDIQWIRVYKNPKTTKVGELTKLGELQQVGTYTRGPGGPETNPVVTPPGFPNRRARLFPSLWKDYEPLWQGTAQLASEADTYFWVDIDPTSGELEEDPDKPGNSGHVMPGQNDTVVPGDIVAIAINVKLRYCEAVREFITPKPGPDPVSMADPVKNLPPLLHVNNHYPVDVDKPRTVDWTENFLPLLFNDGEKANPVNTVWARNAGTDREIAGGMIVAAVGIEGVGILNPNYPLERIRQNGRVNYLHADHSVTGTEWGHPGVDGYHTIVYQFKVTKAHESLNALGEWLAGMGTTVAPFNVPYRPGFGFNYEYADFYGVYPKREGEAEPHGHTYEDITALHEQEFGFAVPFGDTSAEFDAGQRWSTFLDPSALLEAGVELEPYPDSPDPDKADEYRHHRLRLGGGSTIYRKGADFKFKPEHFDRNGDGILDYLPVIDDVVNFVSPTVRPAAGTLALTLLELTEQSRTNKDGRVDHYTVSAGFYALHEETEFPHHFPPTYDTAKGTIAYPTIVPDPVAAMTEIVDVPSGTQTGTFTVTLRFQEDYGAAGQTAAYHDATSEELLATLQTALAAGVEGGTVTVSRLGAADAWLRYQVRVVPALGFKGELTFQVPADTVFAHDPAIGNLASNTVTVQIDTVQVVADEIKVVEPEGGAYLAGSEITVEVPFAQDGLTYEGENPPYVTIYLGAREAANARHAVWQQGEERSGSTIVPFAYVLQATDPPAASVSVEIDSINSLAVPRETTLKASSGLERRGTADPAMAPGQAAPISDSPSQPTKTFDVAVTPVVYIPQDDTVSKAVASTVPRSPIVFNELGNGSEATNDWLEFRNVTGSDVSLKDWELSVVADGKKEDTSLIVFPDVSVPANGLLLITNSASDKTPLAGGAQKGLSHASLVDAGLSLPDDGKFLLILRNAKEKLGLDEAFIDVAGGGGSDTDAFVRDETGDYDTHVWPLQVLESPGDATEDALSSGKVWQRAKADLIGYHRDAWAEAAFTGIGYDRKVTQSPATAGTPGYPNGAVKTEASTPKGAVTISEIMFDSEGGTLPQWIELYNKSKTEALNLNRWQLEIQNRNSGDLVGRPIVTLTLQEKVIQPNQTLLIVAGDARASSTDVFPEDRVYNLLELHEKNLRIKTARDTFLSGEGFYLKLSDRNGTKIDEVGNIDDNRRTDDAPVWVWPTNRRDGARSSVVRRYDKGAVARDGMLKSNWALAAHFNKFKVESLHYGHADDIGTPGYRQGGALPVELSSFTLTRTDAGPVVVSWTTESEVDNAGFNLRRSLKRDSGFTLLNPVLIAGAGTTGERQTYTFTDTSAKPGVEYYYQIEEVSLGGRPEVLRTRYLPGPVSPANRSLTTFGEVKQRE